MSTKKNTERQKNMNNVQNPKYEIYDIRAQQYVNDGGNVTVAQMRGDNNLVCLLSSEVRDHVTNKHLYEGDLVRDVATGETFIVKQYLDEAGFQKWNVSALRKYEFIVKYFSPNFSKEMIFLER